MNEPVTARPSVSPRPFHSERSLGLAGAALCSIESASDGQRPVKHPRVNHRNEEEVDGTHDCVGQLDARISCHHGKHLKRCDCGEVRRRIASA